MLSTETTSELRLHLEHLKDELELFGWRAEDTSRYARQALKAWPIASVIKLFEEFVAEERSYYSRHAPPAAP